MTKRQRIFAFLFLTAIGIPALLYLVHLAGPGRTSHWWFWQEVLTNVFGILVFAVVITWLARAGAASIMAETTRDS
ncbi:MAG TPA: hypothetical protein VGM77_06990 [Gemmatimonadales bacterium]